MTQPTNDQHPSQVEQLQREWLQKARDTNPPNILRHARQTGERLHDQRIAELEKTLKLVRRRQAPSEPPHIQDARQRFQKGNTHHSDSDPVWAALKPFLSAADPGRPRLEAIARDYLSLETSYREQAESQADPDRKAMLHQLADAQRDAADQAIADYRLSPHPPLPKQSNHATRPLKDRPIPLKTLQKIVSDFQDMAWSCAANGIPPENAAQPAIRFDKATLLAHWEKACPGQHLPQEFHILLLGPRGDHSILAANQRTQEEHRKQVLKEKAQRIINEADDFNRKLTKSALVDAPLPHPDRLYSLKSLLKAWTDSGSSDHMPDAMTLLLTGEKGATTRSQTYDAVQEQRRLQELETDSNFFYLTNFERVQKRTDPSHTGPDVGMTTTELIALWDREGPGGPMPRNWYGQSKDLRDHVLRNALKGETKALTDSQAAVGAYNTAAELRKRKSTLSTLAKEAIQSLRHLDTTGDQVDWAFTRLNVEPPPRPQGPSLPAHLEPSQQRSRHRRPSPVIPCPTRPRPTTPPQTPRRPPQDEQQPQTAALF